MTGVYHVESRLFKLNVHRSDADSTLPVSLDSVTELVSFAISVAAGIQPTTDVATRNASS